MKFLFAFVPLAIGLAVAPVQVNAAPLAEPVCIVSCAPATVPQNMQVQNMQVQNMQVQNMQVADSQMQRYHALRNFEARNRADNRRRERAAVRAERQEQRAKLRQERIKNREYRRDLRAFQEMERARR